MAARSVSIRPGSGSCAPHTSGLEPKHSKLIWKPSVRLFYITRSQVFTSAFCGPRTRHHRVPIPARRPEGRHPAPGAYAPCSQAASPPHPAWAFASRSSLPSQIHCSPSSDGSMGIPQPSGPFGPPGSPRPAQPGRHTRRGAPRLLPPYAPCHALWSLPPSSGFAAAASPRALRASGFAAALRAWQTSPYRDHCDLRMGYPLSCSQTLSSSALQRVACLPNRLS